MKPKINRDRNNAKMHFGPFLEILTLTDGELWHGQAQMGKF